MVDASDTERSHEEDPAEPSSRDPINTISIALAVLAWVLLVVNAFVWLPHPDCWRAAAIAFLGWPAAYWITMAISMTLVRGVIAVGGASEPRDYFLLLVHRGFVKIAPAFFQVGIPAMVLFTALRMLIWGPPIPR